MPNRILPPSSTLKELYESGLCAREIALKLSVNKNTVASALRRIDGLAMRDGSEAQLLAFRKGRKPNCYWSGKKQPKEMVELRVSKIRGPNHYLWKGGLARRQYRDIVKKEKCANCSARINLCIHHVDFDHYNNKPDNLQVLCLHCHLGLHKKHYWDCYRKGVPHKKSTAPDHWKGGKDGDR